MIGKYSKAVIAFLTILTTGIGGIAALVTSIGSNEQISSVLPPSWATGIIAVGAAITALGSIVGGVLTWFLRNQQTVDQVDEGIKRGDLSINDVIELTKKYGRHAKLDSSDL